jgi:hypothetical protein
VIAYAANDRVEDSGKRNTGQQERSTTGEVNQRNGEKPTGDGDGGDHGSVGERLCRETDRRKETAEYHEFSVFGVSGQINWRRAIEVDELGSARLVAKEEDPANLPFFSARGRERW